MAVADAIATQPAAPSFDGIFPLPLTTFETLMFVDGRPDYPMLADVQLHFQGAIRRAAFDRALAFATARNPLFVSLIAPAAKGGWQWTPSNQAPRVDWAPLGTPIAEAFGQPIDLTREIGLRLFVRVGEDASSLLFQFHHAISDGMGIYGFIEDLLAEYVAATPGAEPVEPRPLEPARLVRRGLIHVTGRSLPRVIFDSLWGAVEGFRFLTEAPLVLPPQVDASQGCGQALAQSATCDEATVNGLRRAAIAGKANVNDLLVRDLMLTLRRWHAASGPEPTRRRLRVLVPQNLREADDARMPSCNAMSFAFITRRAKWCDEPARLLTSIAEETAKIRDGFLSLYFLGGLASVQGYGLLPWLLRQRTCFATVVMSNLSDPTRRFTARFRRSRGKLVAGNLILDGINVVPPLRPLTRATMGVTFLDGEMTISMKCDPHCYSPSDVRRLLDAFVEQLCATATASAS